MADNSELTISLAFAVAISDSGSIAHLLFVLSALCTCCRRTFRMRLGLSARACVIRSKSTI